ncbi:MAG: peroxiredoxin [Gammaproteobacteria bacterium]|nr:MAG: peroxiredoxin [Gammaproteobacteria bacterium]
MLEVGSTIPDVTLKQMTESGPKDVSMSEYTRGRKVLIFALPGPFTPTCSESHVPSYIVREEDLRARGVEAIACISTADFFVMDAWGKHLGVGNRIDMLADGNSEFTRAAGMLIDLSEAGLGERSQRYAMIVDDGKVTHIEVESNPGKADVSGAEHMLRQL